MDAEWERAALSGDVSVLVSRLEAGTDVDARDRYGQTALMLAARSGHQRACKALADAGADLNVTAKYGLSALMLAVLYRHQEVARLLARAGADLRLVGSGAPGFAGKSASDLARDAGLDALADELSC